VVSIPACSKRENRRGRVSGAIPIPVSTTSKRSSTLSAVSSSRAARRVTLPLAVNLSALLR
jgi:hypothetical protein